MASTRHTILVSGSITYDHILDFPGKFQDHILAKHLEKLSVAFYVNHVSITYGGAGANIAYNLGLLHEAPVLLASAGDDFTPSRKWLNRHNVDTRYVKIKPGARTSAVYIMTDTLNNQISAFYPGVASTYPTLPKLNKRHIDFAISSLSSLEDTWRMPINFAKAKIPYAFDPGQRITALTKTQLLRSLTGATMLFANEYEHAILLKKTGLTAHTLLKKVGIIITTMGVKGSRIQTAKRAIHVHASRPKSVLDPTGAGDAYRAGFVYGYLNNLSLRTCAEIGSVTSTFAIEHYGTQVHEFTKRDIAQRLRSTYTTRVPLP